MMRLTAVVLCILSLCSLAHGGTYTVPGDYASIQAAIDNAPDDSLIVVSAGTYAEELRYLSKSKTLYIRSASGPDSTLIDGGGTRTLIYIMNAALGDPTKNVTFDGFTFTRGRGETFTSPITIADASPRFYNCKFINNSAPQKAGAVLAYDARGSATHPVFVNCTFTSNVTDRLGGAVLVSGGHPNICFKDSVFEHNSNRTALGTNDNIGGCIYLSGASSKIAGCHFYDNSAAYAGGAIVSYNMFSEGVTDSLEVRGCTFRENFSMPIPGLPAHYAPSEAGAIHLESKVTAFITDCYFSNNWAAAGGAVNSYRAPLQVRNCVFEDNFAVGTNLLGFGGAIAVNLNDVGDIDRPEAICSVSNTMIRGCDAPAGGGIFFGGDLTYGNNGTLYLDAVTIDSCLATTNDNSYGNGGGIFLNMTDCVASNLFLLNNRAEYVGGGMVIVQATTLALNNSVVAGNQAAVDHDIHNPASLPYSTQDTIWAYNGGWPLTNATAFASMPPITVGRNAYFAHFAAPYTNAPSITPGVGALPDLGGFTAGSSVATGITQDTTFFFSSGQGTQQVAVTGFPSGLRNAPYHGSPVTFPVRVEAEDFDNGGQHVTYHDLTAGNSGGSYRPGEDVDIAFDAGASASNILAWTGSGEWLEYTVLVTTAGWFDVSVQVASLGVGGTMYLQVDGTDETGNMVVPDTGGWTTWTGVTKEGVFFSAGWHVVRMFITSGQFAIDFMDWTASAVEPEIAASVASLSRQLKQGRAGIQNFEIWNSGIGTLVYSLSNSVAWLATAPTNGTSDGEHDSIQVQYDASALATGVYNTSIWVLSTNAPNSPFEIPVELTVAPDRDIKNDFDGDGLGDYGVYVNGLWTVEYSVHGTIVFAFGTPAHLPFVGNFNGDDLADVGVYDPTTGSVSMFVQAEGLRTDTLPVGGVPVVGDFDGDGEDDYGVYVNGLWTVEYSIHGTVVFAFGTPTHLPFVGNFNGDTLDDVGVYDPATGVVNMFVQTEGLRVEALPVGGAPVQGPW